MKNKDLAYDYIYDFMYRTIDVADQVPNEDRFDDQDKQELQQMLGEIGIMSQNSGQLNQMAEDSLQQTLAEQYQLARENNKNTIDTMINLKNSLTDTIENAKRAYTYVLWMYIATFLLGIALIVVAIVFAAQDKMILAAAFGAVGLIDLLSYVIFKPPMEIQNSRSNLAQLTIIITNWFADLMNLNTYMNQNIDGLDFEGMKKISDKQNDNTAKMIELIEKYGEIRPSKK